MAITIMMVIVRNINTVTMKMTVMTTTMTMIVMTFMICKWYHVTQKGAI